MKKKLLMALLVGVLAVPSSVSCFAAESTDAAAADSDEEEETEETEAEDKDTTAKKKENLKTVGEKKDGCIAFKLRNATSTPADIVPENFNSAAALWEMVCRLKG